MNKILPLMAFSILLLVPVGAQDAFALPPLTVQKITASDAEVNDKFGRSVAVSGDTAVIGAIDDDDGGTDSGSVYVFTRSGNTWSEQAKLTASDPASFDQFGFSVAVSGDTAVIGAYLNDDDGTDSGSAYVFTRSGTTWTEQQKLTASDAALDDEFGRSVAVSGDTVVVGASGDDTSTGSAYVFTRSGTTWSEQQKLTASDGAAADQFGFSVAISDDTAVVGANLDDDVPNNSGSAYVFTRSGTTWTEQQKLTASDPADNDRFGRSVAVSGDTAVVGALQDDDAGISSGSAYVFTRSGTTWSEQQKLTASDAAPTDQFGVSVAVSGDTAVVGAHFDTNVLIRDGSAYVFTRSGTTWTEEAKLAASVPTEFDELGGSVAVSGDTIVVGAHLDDEAGDASGTAYVYFVLSAPDPPVGGEFLPIETTSLILAGAQTFSWMIPVALSVLGIGLFVLRKSENSE